MTNRIRFAAATVGLFVVVACGGGGGGEPPATPSLLYRTDWAKSNQPSGGASQRITLFRLDGTVVSSLKINRPGLTIQEARFDAISAGSYRFLAELYSQPDLAGVPNGQVETQLTINGPTTLESAVGEPVSGVAVTPDSATLAVPESVRFYVMALGGGKATFSKPSDFKWEALGGIASVSTDGLAEARSAGSGSIRATHITTGRSDSAALKVTGGVGPKGKWTVLVYMNAANDLFSFSTLNMNQIETVAQNPDVRFVVQWKQSQSLFPNSTFDGTRRYLAKPDSTNAVASQLVQDLGVGVDMGIPSTLSDFVAWGKHFYPADHYVLVIWNHGNGWRRSIDELPGRAFSYDDETGSAIQIWQLKSALGAEHFDILAWDASLMQMHEVAYEARHNADFVVGSEESPPGEGYPYDLVFAPFRDSPNTSPRSLAKSFVDGMLAVPGYSSRKITESVIESSALPALSNAIDALAGELLAHQADLAAIIPSVRNQTQPYSQTSTRYYRDLVDFCERLEAATTIASVDAASAAVRAAATNAIVWEGHNSNSAFSNGISIDMSPSDVFASAATDYSRMEFAQDTRWDEWLFVAP